MRKSTLKTGMVLAFNLLLHVTMAQAAGPLLIVTDPWAPYTLLISRLM